MENLSLEERVLYGNVSPSLFETKMVSGKTDLQYLESGNEIISYFRESLKKEKNNEKQFIDFSTSSNENFIQFYTHLQNSWDVYLDLSSRMNSFSENIKFLFPEKLKIFSDLIQTTFDLNVHLYFITDIEKEIYERNMENLPEERMLALMESVKSLPVYLSKNIGLMGNLTKNPYQLREMLSQSPSLRKLFSLSGSSVQLLGKLVHNIPPLRREAEQEDFMPQNQYEEALKGILVYDHFFELFLRKSGILMNDLKFYVDIAERVSCKKSISSILAKLSGLNENFNEGFRPDIPQYHQTQLSCGATCLANVVGTYYPYVKVDKSLEDGIHKLVTVKGFFNNLPSSLVLVSRDEFGIPASFFADFRSFVPLFLEQKATQEPLKKFQEDYHKIESHTEDYENMTPLEIKDKLQKGHFISFVTGQSPMLHYKMIVGYNFRKDQNYFYVFDPSDGITKILESELLQDMRNDKSLWGVEYIPPESVIFEKTKESLTKVKELLSWEPQ